MSGSQMFLQYHNPTKIQAHVGDIYAIAFSNDILLTAGYDKIIRAWSLDNFTCKYHSKGHSHVIKCLAIYSNIIISGSWDKNIKLWNLSNGSLISTLSGHNNRIKHLTVMKSGAEYPLLASGADDLSIIVWDLLGYKSLFRLNYGSPITSLSLTSEVYPKLAYACIDQSIILKCFTISPKNLISNSFKNHDDYDVNSILLSSKFFDETESSEISPSIISHVCFSTNNIHLLCAYEDGKLLIFNVIDKTVNRKVLANSFKISSIYTSDPFCTGIPYIVACNNLGGVIVLILSNDQNKIINSNFYQLPDKESFYVKNKEMNVCMFVSTRISSVQKNYIATAGKDGFIIFYDANTDFINIPLICPKKITQKVKKMKFEGLNISNKSVLLPSMKNNKSKSKIISRKISQINSMSSIASYIPDILPQNYNDLESTSIINSKDDCDTRESTMERFYSTGETIDKYNALNLISYKSKTNIPSQDIFISNANTKIHQKLDYQTYSNYFLAKQNLLPIMNTCNHVKPLVYFKHMNKKNKEEASFLSSSSLTIKSLPVLQKCKL